MQLNELYDYYGSWAVMARKLELGNTTYLRWRNKGYIPYSTQCVIEQKTGRKFKADLNHGRPVKQAEK